MLCKSNPIRDLTCLKVTWSNSCVWLDILAFIDKEKWQKKKGLKWKHLIFMHYWSFHSISFFIFDGGGMERLLHLNSSDTLGGHFIKHLFLVLGLEPFCLLHHRVNKEVETFLRYFGLYYHNICCVFISCTSTMWNSHSNTKGALLDLDLVAAETI